MKYAFMKEHRNEFDLTVMCSVLSASRSGFYDWLKRDNTEKEANLNKLRKIIEEIFIGSRKSYGSPRVFDVLTGMGIKISEDTVARLMREMGLRAKSAKKFKVRTTDSKHSFPIAENKLNQVFDSPAPNKIWLSDLTYIETGEGWLYLCSILDLCSRKIVGWSMSTSLHHEVALSALDMAVKRQKPGRGLIFHTDRGVQYACHGFRGALDSHGFIASMSRTGNCYDNAPKESFFHTLKTEYVHHESFATIEEAKAGIFEWIECFYNRQRIHSSIGYKTPVAMEETFMLAEAA